MKFIAVLFALSLPFYARAVEGPLDRATTQQIRAWAQSLLDRASDATEARTERIALRGRQTDTVIYRPCALTISNQGDGLYYLGVGFTGSTRWSDFAGLFVGPDTQFLLGAEIADSRITLNGERIERGNTRVLNQTLTITRDEHGQPTRILGTSDAYGPIDCTLEAIDWSAVHP